MMDALVPLAQDELWNWLVEPDLLQQWSPVVSDRPLDAPGPATSQESPGAPVLDATVDNVRSPWQLCHRWGPDTITWQLAPCGDMTQLHLVHELADATLMADAAAGWHLCLTVLGLRTRGADVARVVGQDALAHDFEALREQYRKLLPEPAHD